MSTTAENNTPVWFLDVDGVINQITKHKSPGFRLDKISPGNGDYYKYPIRWNPEITQRIHHMHHMGIVEVQWLTTWGSGANGYLRRCLGLPEFVVAGEPPQIASGDPESYYNTLPEGEELDWWKHTVVRLFHFRNPERPIIWTDDDLIHEKNSKQWLVGKNIFALAPDQKVSLTMHDLDCIEDYAVNGFPS